MSMIWPKIYLQIQNFFADDTFLFSVVRDLNISANEVNDDMKKIKAWAHQWKMSFDLDPLDQAQEFTCSRKRNKPHHPTLLSTAIQ